MKNINLGKIYLVLALILSISNFHALISQGSTVENYRTSFEMTTLKKADNTRDLKVEFTATNKEDKKDVIAVSGAEIEFFNILNDEENSLGKATTDGDGKALLSLPADQKYLVDEDSYFTIVARYEGNDVMDYEESEIMLRDVFLEMEVIEEDDVRTLNVNAYTMDADGEKSDVEEMDIKVGVQGLLSRLVLEEGTLEAGSYEFEVPEDIHGNSEGDLTFYAYVDDNMEYGSVYQKASVKDNTKIAGLVHEDHKLWTKAAPLWMYIVLSIMLIGVWANYVYTVVNLTKIKKLSKN